MLRLCTLFFVVLGVLAKPPLEKCKVTDAPCMLNMANHLYALFFQLNDHLDPMHQDLISGDPKILNFTLTDIVIRGFKDCKVEYTNIDFDKLSFDNTLICPKLEMVGNYAVNGLLQGLPIEGIGNYSVQAPQFGYKMHKNIDLTSKDGKTYMQVKSFTLELDPREPIVTKIDNLFNGDTEKAAPIESMFRDNWKEITKKLYKNIFASHIQVIVDAANKFFKGNNVEEYISL